MVEKENINKEEKVEEKTSETSTEKTKKDEKKEKKDKFLKEIEAKNDEIAKLKEQLESFKDKYYRTLADLDNQRKQYDKEYSKTLKYASQNLAEKLIPSFEMFSIVVGSADHLPSEVQAYVQGFNMVYRQMVQALESEGVSEIQTKVGDEFDHRIHSAMETQEVEDESLNNKITKVINKGYMIHDRLIKPVTVVVGKLKVEKENGNENQESEEAQANA